MHTDFYGLSFNPFDKQMVKEKDAFESEDFREMTARLEYLKEIRGIGVFTASPGMGKTFALRCFAKGLNPNLYQCAYLCLSTVSVQEFYRQLCEALGLESGFGKSQMFRSIQERLYYLYKEKRRPFICILDEAQYLNSNILRDLKMLMNQKYDSVNCFSLILCGEPYLNHILEKQVNEALRQRIVVHYNFHGLTDQEVPDYIRKKIRAAGGSPDIIDTAAISSVHSYSQGNPRLIDNVMTDAMTIGNQMEKKVIDADVMLAAINNQTLS